jgi:tetratricopeptide (TPR) repeat protein
MAGIFISYRRQDSDHALTLYLWLLKRFGRESIFWDQKDIDPGRDFLHVIEQRIAASSALIALIGKGWLELADEDGRRRIDSPDDVLRHEIAAALRQGILVLPVLGSAARMPEAGELPEEIAGLSHRQALTITDMQFHARLEESLAAAGISTPQAPAEAQSSVEQIARRAGNLLRRQTSRLQVRAKELIREGKSDRVAPELSEGVELLMALLDLLPGEEGMDLELGFLFGGYGRLFIDAGDRAQAERFLDLAMSIFRRVDAELASIPASTSARASAIKGIGEVHYNRGDLHEAIRWYRAAIDIEPAYSYAWHDLFGAHDALARRGEIDLPAMRLALEGTKLSSGGLASAAQPGLDRQYLARMEGRLAHWETVAAQYPHLVADAEDRCTAAIAEKPDDPEAYYQRARVRAARNDPARAIEDYSAAIARGKDDATVHLERGGLHFVGDQYAEADSDFTAALQRGHVDAAVHLYRGRARLALGDRTGAAADFSAAIGLGDKDGYFYRGLAQLRQSDFAAAESDFSTAIEIDAQRPEAFRWRGIARAKTGDHKGAAADFAAAIDSGQRDADVLFELGEQRMALGDAAGADTAFGSAIELGRDDPLVYVARAMTRATRGDGAGAAADFQTVIEKGAGRPFIYYMLGRMRSWQDDAAGAEQSLTTAIDGGYVEGAAFRLRGAARHEQGNHAAAEADFDEAIARGEDDAEIHLKRAMSRVMQMNAAGAEADFTTAIERDGNNAYGYYGRALVRRIRGDAAGTFADCTGAIEHGLADPAIHRMRARAGARLGHLAIAEADCIAADAAAPDHPETHLCWGDLHLARREYEQAERRYRARLGASPDPQASFSLGLALRLTGRIDESDEAYLAGLEDADPSQIAQALSDLGLWTPGDQAADTTASLRARLEAKMAAGSADAASGTASFHLAE